MVTVILTLRPIEGAQQLSPSGGTAGNGGVKTCLRLLLERHLLGPGLEEVSRRRLLLVLSQDAALFELLPLFSTPSILLVASNGIGDWTKAIPREKPGAMIVLLRGGEKKCSSLLGKLAMETSWNPDARLLLVIKTKSTDQSYIRSEVQKAMQECWDFHMVHVAVVVITKSQSRVGVYGSKPFTKGHCSPHAPAVQHVLVCRALSMDEPYTVFIEPANVQLFPSGKLHNLGGCTLPVATFEFPPYAVLQNDSTGKITRVGGVDGELVLALAKAMNFSAHFYVPPDNMQWGQVFTNGSGNGALGELASGHAAMGVAGIMPMPMRVKHLTMSSCGYRWSKMAWALPKPRRQAPWVSMLAPFSTLTWLAVAGTLLFASIVIAIISKNQPISGGAWLFPWGTLLGVSAARLPVTTPQRMLVVAWLLACLVLSAAYQGALFSVLAGPRPQPAPNTLSEVVDSGLTLGGHPNLVALFDEGTDKASKEARRSYKPLENVVALLYEVAKGHQEMALAVNRDMLLWFNVKYYSDGQTVHIAEEDLTAYPTAIFLPKHSPHSKRVNHLVRVFSEAGLVNKWYDDLAKIPEVKADPTAPSVLTMQHFEACFLCLITGLTIAAAALFGEVLVAMLQDCKRRDAVIPRRRVDGARRSSSLWYNN